MGTSVLVVVDVQNDFCAGGPLAVPDAEAILPVVNGLVAAYRRVVFTQDWHPPGHVSFASSHPGRRVGDRIAGPSGEQILWPDHCVAGTAGAAFHPGLRMPRGAPVVRKNDRRDVDRYSAFEDDEATGRDELAEVLREAGADQIVVVGLATDFCVLHTALDGRRLGYSVTVVESACRGIDLDGSLADAWERMAAAGVGRA